MEMKINTQKIFVELCNDGLVGIFENKISEFQSELKELNSKKLKKYKEDWDLLIKPLTEEYEREIKRFKWLKRRVITYNQDKLNQGHVDLDELLKEIDIINIIGRHTKLTRLGKEYRGLCPFHSEKTPSFFVNPKKGVYHCFGCGSSGNIITFLTKHDGLSFKEAINELKNEM